METRRNFLRKVIIVLGTLVFRPRVSAGATKIRKYTENPTVDIYRAINGDPSENVSQVMELMGGIENIFGHEDVIVIKPNIQWYNQGATNLSALKTFIDLIINRPGGFHGEVVIAENCHRGLEPWKSAG